MADRQRTVDRRRAELRDSELVARSVFSDQFRTQSVAKRGYVWRDADGVRSIVPADTMLADASRISPASEPGLFIEFARLDPTEEAFVGFANRFGLLAIPDYFEPDRNLFPVGSEPWVAWVDAHRKIGRASALWDSISKDRPGDWVRPTVQRFHKRNRSDWTLTVPSGFAGAGETETRRFDIGLQSEALSPVIVAQAFLQSWVNAGNDGQARVVAVWDEERKSHVSRVIPRTLLGSMWWQILRAFTGETAYAKCAVCNSFLPLGSDGFRRDKTFCGNTCTQRDHRRKVKAAKSMAANGESVELIAKHFDATPAVIQNWLTKKK